MKKRTLALILALVLVFGAAVGGTIAYLTDTDTVTNTFTVGKVDITLDEAKVTEYGVIDSTANTRVTENTYKLIPGHNYTKDPTIHVAADSEDCWLFAKIENGLGEKATLNIDATKWTKVTGTENVWAYNTKVSAGANVTVFTQFTFSKDVTATQLPSYDAKTIVVTACAVQADGFATAAAAYDEAPAAFKPAT